jgi:hypothetical protein
VDTGHLHPGAGAAIHLGLFRVRKAVRGKAREDSSRRLRQSHPEERLQKQDGLFTAA